VWRPGWWAWAWIAASGLALVLGAVGFWIGLWVDGALGAGIGVAAGVAAPLLVELVRRRVETSEAARRVEPAARRLGPASLLDPALEVVPFTGRQKELDELLAWCGDSAAGPIRLVTGGGGAGKTRLALEFRRRLEKDGGWRCADVDAGTEASALKAERAAAGGRRLHLVVDYADARPRLSELLDAVARDPERVRVLLLARQVGEWWQRLQGGGQAVRDLVADASRELIELVDAIVPGFSAADVVLSALPWFAARLEVTVADVGLVRVTCVEQARILDLHAAALVAVLEARERRPPTAVSIDVGTVLDVLLGHEKRYWQDSARLLKLFDVAGGLSAIQLSQVTAAMCLLGAASEDEAAGLSGRVPGAAPSTMVALWLRGLYPPDAEGLWLGSLRPDRLAELLATRELAASPVFARNCLSQLPERQAQQALLLLARASTDHPAVRPLLESALLEFPEAPAGIRAPRETLIAVANSIPFPSITLDAAGADLSRRIVATYTTGTSERASWQETSSDLLAALGRREEALAAIEEAVAIRREVAAARPDAFRPDLADSLNKQAVRLSALGRREEALAAIEGAVAIRRELAGARPDAFRPDLAGSLNNQSICLSDLGQREEALAAIEEAVAIYQEVAAARPDRFRPRLADSLNNRALRLSDLGRREEALTAIEEAVAIRRELAGARPDAFRPDLATSLNNRAQRLSDLGRQEEALTAIEEAVAIRRELAGARPDAFRPDLAGSLITQSNRLSDLGRQAEALTAIEEAVAIYRDVARARPDAFRHRVATSLNNRALRLSDLGRQAEALTAIEEAVAIYRDLARARPDAFRHRVATSLNNRALRLSDLGRQAEALTAIEEAVAIYRELARALPDAFRHRLAGSLNNRAQRLSDLRRREEALTAIEEAVAIYRELSAARPAVFAHRLAGSLSVTAVLLSKLGRKAEAEAANQEAARISHPTGDG
jgi:tetratricopeptide (TPR) repeat protein